MTESDQIEALQKTVLELTDKFVAGKLITCPLLAEVREQNKALEKRHREDIAEITQRLSE